MKDKPWEVEFDSRQSIVRLGFFDREAGYHFLELSIDDAMKLGRELQTVLNPIDESDKNPRTESAHRPVE